MLTLTPSAKVQVQKLLQRAENPNAALRVFVSPGGCSGMSYGMQLDDQEQEGDTLIQEDGVRVVVDEMSAMYLAGSQIDYSTALMGGGFQVQNPNAVKSCACGHSFDTGKDAETARVCH
jgi:iron-sulfur cluster assembly protein